MGGPGFVDVIGITVLAYVMGLGLQAGVALWWRGGILGDAVAASIITWFWFMFDWNATHGFVP